MPAPIGFVREDPNEPTATSDGEMAQEASQTLSSAVALIAGSPTIISGLSPTRTPQHITKDIQQALLNRGVALFERDGTLVEIYGGGSIRQITSDRLLSILEDHVVIDDRIDEDEETPSLGEEESKKKPGRPKKDKPRWRRSSHDDLRVILGKAQTWARPLRGMVRCPYVTEDGQLASTYGYNAQTHVFHNHERMGTDIDGKEFSLDAALGLVNKLLDCWDFPEPVDRAHAFALLMLPVVRPSILGPTPLHVVSAASAGKGKSALGEVVGALAGEAVTTTPSEWASEAQRELQEWLRAEPDVMLLDNVPRSFVSSKMTTLMSYVTGDTFNLRGRIGAGQSTVKIKAIWVLTAINLDQMLSLEIASRSVVIRTRGATIPTWSDGLYIKDYVKQNRSIFLAATLRIAQEAMKLPPIEGPTHPRAPQWSTVMKKILSVAGLDKHFLTNTPVSTDDYETSELFKQWPPTSTGEFEELSAAAIAELATQHSLPMWSARSCRADVAALGRRLSELASSKRTIGRWYLSSASRKRGRIYFPVLA